MSSNRYKTRHLYKSNTFQSQIEKIIYGGSGITSFDGIKVFVPYSAPNDYLQLRIVLKRSKYYFAEIAKIIKPSPMRVRPACPYFTECGGCDLQHINYSAQLEIKQNFAVESMNRIGHMNLKKIPPIISSQPFHYRNKTQYPLVGHPLRIGFYRQLSHHVVDVDKCLLHPPIFDRIRKKIKELIIETREPIYNEQKHSGNLRHIIIRQGINTGEILLTLVTRTERLNTEAYKSLLIIFPELTGITQNINPDRTNRILGSKNRLLFGNNYHYEKILDKQFKISSSAFFQVNTAQAEQMAHKLREYIGQANNILDLYCGVGVLAIIASNLANKVYGVELNAEAINDAKTNAQLNNIFNIEFIAAPVEAVALRYKKIDTVILDPPRKGCSEILLNDICKLKPEKIIYISCNPTTFARDMAILKQKKYILRNYELIDMFPQTYHVESIAKITAQ